MQVNNELIEPGPFEQTSSPDDSSGSQSQDASQKEASPTADGDEAGSLPDSDPSAVQGAQGGAQAAKPAPIFKGIQREIGSVEELSAYALELEKQTLEQQAKLSGFGAYAAQAQGQAQPAPQPNVAQGLNYEQLGEEFILNPKGAVQKIVDYVQGSVLGTVNQQVGRTEFFRNFYEANEDLVGCEDLVEASVARNSAQWAKIPLDKAAKLLAEDVRARAAKIRAAGGAQAGIPLPNRQAAPLPSGSNPAPKVAPPPEAPQTFAAQLRVQQARHRSPALKH